MTDFIIENEKAIRLWVFFGVLATMAAVELMLRKRPLIAPKGKRWAINIGITFFNTFLARIVIPAGAVGAAIVASNSNIGIFNRLSRLSLPSGLNVSTTPDISTIASTIIVGVICIIALDLLIYAQHVAFHYIKPLWRLHMMHHTDLDLDVTSGARFHPVEILLSILIKMAAVLALGAPAWSVVVFEVLLNATAMFNHSNIRLPLALDRVMRLVVVTPDMHRVHHSVIIRETNSNFGFNLPWWDRIFRTYIAQPRQGHKGMTIGLANFRDFSRLGFLSLMALPFTVEKEKL